LRGMLIEIVEKREGMRGRRLTGEKLGGRQVFAQDRWGCVARHGFIGWVQRELHLGCDQKGCTWVRAFGGPVKRVALLRMIFGLSFSGGSSG
jgi:hypothetical protein